MEYDVHSKDDKVTVFFTSVKLLTISIFIVSVMSSLASSGPKIKQPNVSGQFYNANPKQLSANIDKFFSKASIKPSDRDIDILIAPHAGYVYSGGVAAYGFKAASQQKFKTILVLAPSHHFGFDGISVWEEGGFKTPLGVAEVDAEFTKKLIAANKKFYFEPRAFQSEHALEVEIPFIQKTFQDFKIVPVVFGHPSFELLEDFAIALQDLIGTRNDVLIVVSTDLSHYHDDASARNMDRRTIQAVKDLKIEQLWKECKLRTMEMCGHVPVTAALLYARQKGLTDVDVLHYANSGDVSGDKDRVVGYASIIVYGNDDKEGKLIADKDNIDGVKALTPEHKKRLMDIARRTVETYVKTGKKLDVKESDARLLEEEGAFVTIHKKSYLRGCIGNIIGTKPLYITVRDMAVAAASQDPRFPPVESGELNDIDIEISVLSKPRVIKDVGEIELGTHGVIVSQGPWHRGVFLPQVATDTGWSKEEFLSQLCSQKAHLPRDAWKDPKTKIEIFTANVFSEKNIH
ncbi:MAG: AmmeMemoRadiSam system protein B [Candidatus Omnitrophica bacterium]|nr:AmmeMemoRadiSam system protein B [Candidatus Omnitrophota bacterium]MCK5259763.1 AmmeMemoRadiSam system protein B [Candidatus Omnitrophota bacterium]